MTLIGTSTNLIVSSFLEDVTGTGLAFFDFLIVGASATVVGLLVLLLSARLLPVGSSEIMDINEYVIEVEVDSGSTLIGKSILANKLRELEDFFPSGNCSRQLPDFTGGTAGAY